MRRQAEEERRIKRRQKKRRRRDLSADEIDAIVEATRQPYKLQKDVAFQYQITAQLVHELVKESENEPQKQVALREKTALSERKKLAIEEVAAGMLERSKPILHIEQVQAAVQEETGLEVNRPMVSRVMRKDLHMGYRLAKTAPIQSNSERCLVLRQ